MSEIDSSTQFTGLYQGVKAAPSSFKLKRGDYFLDYSEKFKQLKFITFSEIGSSSVLRNSLLAVNYLIAKKSRDIDTSGFPANLDRNQSKHYPFVWEVK